MQNIDDDVQISKLFGVGMEKPSISKKIPLKFPNSAVFLVNPKQHSINLLNHNLIGGVSLHAYPSSLGNGIDISNNKSEKMITLDADNNVIIIRNNKSVDCVWIHADPANGGSGIHLRNQIGTDTIHIDGDAGDIRLLNADCAEDFEVINTEEIKPGAVMTLSDKGQLEQGNQPYDKRVAGVVSGAGNLKPGLILGSLKGLTNRLPIALVGKVHCKVDASFGAIEVGDMLTTSSTEGHAMKASDPSKAFGAVIGKALEPLKSGIGFIPILVALQ